MKVALLLALLSIPTAARAASVDLRAGLTPVKNQGEANTCSAFAATALLEFLVKRETGRTEDLSESFTYWAGRQLAPENDYVRKLYEGSDGLAGYLAVTALRFGAMAEASWPYAAAAGFERTPPRARKLPYRAEPLFIERERIGDWLLANRVPVAMNLMWYFALVDAHGDFARVPTAAEAQACAASGQGCGGHVVLLVGYDSGRHRFLFRNSWGAGWGDGGYGTLPEEWVNRFCEVCPHLDRLGQLSPDERDFALKSSRGITAVWKNP